MRISEKADNQDLDVLLPEGWTADYFSAYGVVIERPQPAGGFVTIDFKQRAFTVGMCPVRDYNRIGGGYKGRDWIKTLVTEAIAHLRTCA